MFDSTLVGLLGSNLNGLYSYPQVLQLPYFQVMLSPIAPKKKAIKYIAYLELMKGYHFM